MGNRLSEQAWDQQFSVAIQSSAIATLRCVDTWLTDFRGDLPKLDVPVLVVQGTADRILPIDVTARRLPGLIADLRLVEIEDGPHNIGWTHPEEVNRALVDFIEDDEPTAVGMAKAIVAA